MTLEELQTQIEDLMVSKGADRYAREAARGLTNVGPGKKLMARSLEPVAKQIEADRNPKRGRPKRGALLVQDIDPYILADITARRILDCAAKEEALVKTQKLIAKAVEWHVKDAALNAASASIWNKTQERLKKTNNPEFRRKSIDGTVAGMRRWATDNAPELADVLETVTGPDWDIEEYTDVGAYLIDVFARATSDYDEDGNRTSKGWVEVVTIPRGRRDKKTFVSLSESTAEWVRERDAYHELLRPVLLPMVVPPADWEGMEDGGYLDAKKMGVKFIKTNAKNLDLDGADLTDVYEAVNLLQRTAWRVNRPLFNVMKQAWETGSRLGGLPPRYVEDGQRPLEDMPTKYDDMPPAQRKECTEPAYLAWKNRRRETHEYNADLLTEVRWFGQHMRVAEDYAEYDAFYHPHKLDWRQRIYPLSVFLSPQGDQFSKGLIEFAEGKRMGDNENSGAWLAIHGANCYGIDKVSFEDRIKWVEENHNEILEAAMFPLGSGRDFWTAADKPWPFLAFCFEALAYAISGDDHVTHLPVALDGSNSGLQHLSAMLRDPEGARVTCVAPGEQPEDVYQMVADAVEQELLARRVDATLPGNEPDEWANVWAGKVSRKVVKQPTMTYTYSATVAGMQGQIESVLRDLDGKAREAGESGYLTFTDRQQSNAKAAQYLAAIVRDAISARMDRAAAAMKYLQECARTYSKTGLPLRWLTPAGMPVVQYYPAVESVRRNVFIDGKRYRLSLQKDRPNDINKRKAASGVSPNYVHCMDSTHLMWTTLHCHDVAGIDAFAMIHDSFGTHATNCDQLAESTREMFIALYDDFDRLAQFREHLAAALSNIDPDLVAELPPVPEYGSFDVQSVRESDYFFA